MRRDCANTIHMDERMSGQVTEQNKIESIRAECVRNREWECDDKKKWFTKIALIEVWLLNYNESHLKTRPD